DTAADASSTWGGPVAATSAGKAAGAASGPPSRGYREEMEDFAYCVRVWDAQRGYEKDKEGRYVQRLPRCHGEVAMADAIVALTSNLAMKGRELPVILDGKKVRVNRIEFEHNWFDAESKDVPDGDTTPKVPVE